MKFVSMLPMLRQAVSEGYAVPSFCVWNAESMLVVLRAAARLKAPVILMNGEAEFGLLSPRDMATVARAVAERFNVTAALHLDHGSSPAVAEECLAAGYTSVMLDYSSRPFAENLETLRRLTALARPCGVTVEGELGVIGRADAATVEGEGSVSLTDPQMAAEFVERTGIDALAVSIGNAHGLYTKLPQLDFARLAELQAAARVPWFSTAVRERPRRICAARSRSGSRRSTWRVNTSPPCASRCSSSGARERTSGPQWRRLRRCRSWPPSSRSGFS